MRASINPMRNAGFILDGFPRSVPQAEALAGMLQQRGETISKVVAINVPDDELVKRISGRRTCRNCNEMYHVVLRSAALNRASATNAAGNSISARTITKIRCGIVYRCTTTRPGRCSTITARPGCCRRSTGSGRPEEILNRILAKLGDERQCEGGELAHDHAQDARRTRDDA